MRRSRASALADHGADEAEIKAAISEDLRGEIGTALEGVLHDCAAADAETITAHVAAIVAIIGQDWSHAGRAEFTHVAIQEFLTMPGFLVLDALRRARRKVVIGRTLVSWVSEDVEGEAAKLYAERDRLTMLARVATS